jgi:hypothetical protein
MPVIPAKQGSINSRIMFQARGKNRDPISKITRVKRPGSLVQVCPSKCEALSSPTIPPKTKEKEFHRKLEAYPNSTVSLSY